MKVCGQCASRFDGGGWQCAACGFEPAREGDRLVFAPALAQEAEGFEASFFERLASSEPGHFWFEARNELIFWAMRRFFPRARNFLEVGCGTAFVLSGMRRAFPNLQLSGSEIFTQGLSFAQERLPGVNLFQMDATQIPFENEFDVAGAFDVIEHITDDQAALRGLHQAVKPGGGVIITVPQHMFLWSVIDDFSKHKRRYERAELREKLQAAGFKVEFMTSFISLLLPAMLLSRSRQPKRVEDVDPMGEFRLHPLVNKALTGALALERALIASGARFPAGGSLLAVARKEA